MSAYSTSSPSTEQTRLYLTRPPSVTCTWWNRMSWSSVAEYSFTAMLTRPKETAPRQIDRTLYLQARCPATHVSTRSQDRRSGGVAAGRDQHSAWSCTRRGDRRARGDRPARARSVTGSVLVVPAGHRLLLEGVVGELPDVGEGDHGHGQRGQPGRLGHRRVAEHQGRRRPLRQAERAGHQLADGVLDAAVHPDLLGHLRLAGLAAEGGEGRAQ